MDLMSHQIQETKKGDVSDSNLGDWKLSLSHLMLSGNATSQARKKCFILAVKLELYSNSKC